MSDPLCARSSTMDPALHEEKVSEAKTKFERACQQIVLLDQKIRDLEVRYRRAVKNKKNSFRYNLRLRLSVVTGVKMMYHHYASTKAEELTRLRRLAPTPQNESDPPPPSPSQDIPRHTHH